MPAHCYCLHTADGPYVTRLQRTALLGTNTALVPVPAAWLVSVQESLAAEGLLVEPFGPTTVAVQGVPTVLAKVDPKNNVAASKCHSRIL